MPKVFLWGHTSLYRDVGIAFETVSGNRFNDYLEYFYKQDDKKHLTPEQLATIEQIELGRLNVYIDEDGSIHQKEGCDASIS